MKFNPDIHHRRSIRLKDYDYSSNGCYFITICTQDKAMLFGEVIGTDAVSAQMVLNNAGRMVEDIYKKTICDFANAVMDKYIIMPDHFHGIMIMDDVGAGLVSAQTQETRADTRPAPTLDAVVCAFKSKTTVEYINGVKAGLYQPFNKRIWQRNYYERIIRSEAEYQEIWQYIDENPAKWAEERYFNA